MENHLPMHMIQEDYITNADPLLCSRLPEDNSQNFESENNYLQFPSHNKKKPISERNDPFMSAVQLLISEQSIKAEKPDVITIDDKKSSKQSKSFGSSLPNINSCKSGEEILELCSQKNKHRDISRMNNPFMSARQVDLQPLTNEQSVKTEVCDEPSSSEDEYKHKNLAQDDDKPIPKLPARNIDHQNDETKASKMKPVFGRPIKKSDHTSKISKPPKVDVPDVMLHSKKKKKSDSLSSKVDVDDPKSVHDSNECIDISKHIIDLTTEVCPSVSSENKNELGKHAVPNFACKKPKIKSKLKTDTPIVLETIKESGNEKLKKKRSLTEISSAVLNLDNHREKHSSEDKAPSEKKSKEKKKKSKNSAEKSDPCLMAAEDDPSPQQATEEACNIPKKKRKKSVKNSLLDSEHEAENNGPVITIDADSDQNQDNLETASESLVSTDQPEQKKKTKKTKSKVDVPMEECDPAEKPAKKHKKKKLPKESSDVNENVMVQMMPPEMVPSLEECADEEVVNISDESKGSEESKTEETVESKTPEKSKKQKESSVEKENDKTKKKVSKKHQQKDHEEKSEKKCDSSDPQKVQCKKHYMQEREIFDTGTWVQCTNNKCLKWRFLNDVQDPITVPVMWTCSMHSDKEQNDCSYPEISGGQDDKEFIFTKYTEGTVVWARVDGYPWWPAMVEMDPDTLTYFDIETEESMYPKYYHVVFFGKKVSRAWVTLSNIAPYTKNRPAPVSKGTLQFRVREFRVAEDLAKEALNLPINTRLKMFSFSNRYKGFWANCNCKGCLQSMPTVEPDNEENNSDSN